MTNTVPRPAMLARPVAGVLALVELALLAITRWVDPGAINGVVGVAGPLGVVLVFALIEAEAERRYRRSLR